MSNVERGVAELPVWAAAATLSMAAWPDEPDAVVYIYSSGDLHIVSSLAKQVVLGLGEGQLTTDDLYDLLGSDCPHSRQEFEYYFLPHLASLGVIRKLDA